MTYVMEKDFACPCCGENKVDPGFLTLLGAARERAQMPFNIVQGYVCKARGDLLGYADDDPSRMGVSAVIECKHPVDRLHLVQALITTRFNRIGISENAVFVDISNAHQQDILQIFPSEKRNPG